MSAGAIVELLKVQGQMLDSELAAATGLSLRQVRAVLADMTARGEIMGCNVILYRNDKPVEALQCRLSGYVPRAAPGRKPGTPVR
jgi:hypothetical protein